MAVPMVALSQRRGPSSLVSYPDHHPQLVRVIRSWNEEPTRKSASFAIGEHNSMETTITFPQQQAAARQVVSALLAAVPAPPEDEEPSANPLRDSSPEARNVLLTLYALFEKEFLPALDLLDRGLVTRLKVKGRATSLLLVRSAQQHNNRTPAYEHINHYEVRLAAWSCSCPAFTFAAFPVVSKDVTGERGDCVVGGLTRGSDMPVCKHLLACVLVEHGEMFKHFAVEREVSLEEMAGWAAGWGD